MISGNSPGRLWFVSALLLGWAAQASDAASCVWKVSSPSGATLYLGGSAHALRSSDYPLPAPYNRALEASSHLVFETDMQTNEAATKGLVKAGRYPKGDSLKNHVDPRTYAYVRRYFSLRNIPEQKYSTYRPWLIELILESPPTENAQLGVERYLHQRALASHKPITGLESADEHMATFLGLNDREGEALLLIHFINLGRTDLAGGTILDAWRIAGAAEVESEKITRKLRNRSDVSQPIFGFPEGPGPGDIHLEVDSRKHFAKTRGELLSLFGNETVALGRIAKRNILTAHDGAAIRSRAQVKIRARRFPGKTLLPPAIEASERLAGKSERAG